MSNIDNITKGMGVGPTETFTTGNGTIVATGQFGSLTKSNGMTDGTSVATASKNMAEIYNRILLDMAQCLDLACFIGDPANAPYAISDILPPAQVEARDIEQNWTPIATLAQAIIQGIYTVRLTADNALETANQAVTDGGKFSFTGSIQYEKLTNTITATGLGDNTEVGDVIRVTGTVQNNKLFTVESKINADKVVVNEAHKNGAGPLSLNDETLTSKVELLTKWYNAPIGLGQAWVNVTAEITNGVPRTISQGRDVYVHIMAATKNFGPPSGDSVVRVDGSVFARWGGGYEPDELATSFPLSSNSNYKITIEPTGANSTFKWVGSYGDPNPIFYVWEKR